MGSKGKPYRTLRIEDFEVLVGRSAADNDVVSTQIADPRDTWLHVAEDVAGSHVLIRNADERVIPPTVIERSAELAAWYSKARNRRRVKVHYCRAADVWKPRGVPAGTVQIKNFRVLSVEPRGPDESAR